MLSSSCGADRSSFRCVDDLKKVAQGHDLSQAQSGFSDALHMSASLWTPPLQTQIHSAAG